MFLCTTITINNYRAVQPLNLGNKVDEYCVRQEIEYCIIRERGIGESKKEKNEREIERCRGMSITY